MPHTQPNFVSSRHYVDVTERFINIGFWNADKGMGEVRFLRRALPLRGAAPAFCLSTSTVLNW